MGTKAMLIFTDRNQNYKVYRSMDGYPELGKECGVISDLAKVREPLLARRKTKGFLAGVVEKWIDLYGHREGITHQFGYCQCDSLLNSPIWFDTDHFAEFRYTVDVSNPASWFVKCEELYPWVVIRGRRVKEVPLRGVVRRRSYRIENA